MLSTLKTVVVTGLMLFSVSMGSLSGKSNSEKNADSRLTNKQMRERVLSCTVPAVPLNARIEGCIVLEIRVDTSGRVSNLRLLSGHPLAAKPVIEAVPTWRFRQSEEPTVGVLALCYMNGWDIECKDHKQNQEKS